MPRVSLNPLRWFGAGRARTAFTDLASSRLGPTLEGYGYRLLFGDSCIVEYIRDGKSVVVEYDPVTKLVSVFVELRDQDFLTRVNLWTIVESACPATETPEKPLIASNLKALESSLDLLALMLQRHSESVLLGEPESVARVLRAHARGQLEYNRQMMLSPLPAEIAQSCRDLTYEEVRVIYEDWLEKRRAQKAANPRSRG